MTKAILAMLQWHWYHISPLHLVLFPISLLFLLVSSIRRQLYRYGIFSSIRLPIPVIVVGNITVGGTGKTPLTLWLAEQLLADGWHPGIISRGFGGSGSGSGSGSEPQVVAPESDPELVGDEPVLMAQRNLCPIWVSRDRPAAALALLAAHPECDVIISDDGLQHYRLRRDFDIVVVDGQRRFGNGLLLPAGPMRELPSRIAKADAIVINGGTASQREYLMQLEGINFYNLLNPEITATVAEIKGVNIHAVAGIGHPMRFFNHLRRLGLSFTAHPYPDHHHFSEGDLEYKGANALLMTEKDAVKCRAYADEKYWVLRVDAHLDSALTQLIIQKITRNGSQTT